MKPVSFYMIRNLLHETTKGVTKYLKLHVKITVKINVIMSRRNISFATKPA